MPTRIDLLISADHLKSIQPGNAVVIDTRSSWKYFVGHLPGSINLPDWKDFTITVDGVKGMLNEDKKFIIETLRKLGIDKNKSIVLYGDPADPWRTDGRFFWMFERYGFQSVAILEGGMDLWVKSGGAVERGRGASSTASKLTLEDIQLNPDTVADRNWILERLENPDLIVIDNRTREEYDGAKPYGSERGGHIPKAVHIPWQEFFTANGLLKKTEALKGLLDKYGIRPQQQIVVYCTGGVRSAMAYFVFRYLGYNVRNYDGSWWDWSHQPELPVETN